MANELVIGYSNDMAHRIEDLLKEKAELLDALKAMRLEHGFFESLGVSKKPLRCVCKACKVADNVIAKVEGE